MTTYMSTPRMAMIASLALMVSTFTLSTVGFAAMRIPGSRLPDGTIYVGAAGAPGPTTEPDDSSSKPRSPGVPLLLSRTDHSVTFKWTDNSSYEQGYNLYRGPDIVGPWTRIAVFGVSPGNTATIQYTDPGLSRDTQHWYRVGAYNAHGESFSVPEPFATIDGRKVSRLQLQLHTANVDDANTDDAVHVSLRDNDQGTWLDYGRNDFERGDTFTYELMLNGISDVSDINDILLLKSGTDGWCIESMALLADGVEIFTHFFGASSSTCQWLDDENGHESYVYIGRATLRAHPKWQAYQQPAPPTILLRSDLEARIEGIVGNLIHYGTYVDKYPFYQGTISIAWTSDALDGASHVQVTKKDDQAVHVKFQLDADTPGPGGATVTCEFDLRFTGVARTATAPATITITTENRRATVDFNWLADALTLWLIELADDSIATEVTSAIPDFSQTIAVDQSVSKIIPSVANDGSVHFAVETTPVSRRTLGGTTPPQTTPTKTMAK